MYTPPPTPKKEEDVDAHMCPCGTTIESRAQCEIYKEERDELEAEMKKLDK